MISDDHSLSAGDSQQSCQIHRSRELAHVSCFILTNHWTAARPTQWPRRAVDAELVGTLVLKPTSDRRDWCHSVQTVGVPLPGLVAWRY